MLWILLKEENYHLLKSLLNSLQQDAILKSLFTRNVEHVHQKI